MSDNVAEMTPVPVDREIFTGAFRNHPGGVAVITADAGDGPAAMTVTSVCSVSVDPPLLAFSVSDQSSSTPTVLRASSIMVHLLDADDRDLAILCATSGIDRFADTNMWSRTEAGDPYFHEAKIVLQCSIESRVRAGTATVVIIRALSAIQARSADRDVSDAPLVYHARTWHRLSESSRLVSS